MLILVEKHLEERGEVYFEMNPSFVVSEMSNEREKEVKKEKMDEEVKLTLTQTCTNIDSLKISLKNEGERDEGNVGRGNMRRGEVFHCREQIVSFLYEKLNKVNEQFQKQKELRIILAEEVRKSELRILPSLNCGEKEDLFMGEKKKDNKKEEVVKKGVIEFDEFDEINEEEKRLDQNDRTETKRGTKITKTISTQTRKVEEAGNLRFKEEAFQISEFEEQQLEEENKQLLLRFSHTVDKTLEIQKKLAEISNLSEQFALRILQQAEQVEYIHQTVDNASEYLEQGKQHLNQATKRGVDFRIFSLIFILLLSFSLIFLHWFHD